MPIIIFPKSDKLLTQKLRKKLNEDELTATPVPSTPHLRWYGNLFRHRQTQYILVTNASSLYSVVVYGRGVTDTDLLLKSIIPALREQMDDDGMKLIYERCIAPYLGSVVLAATDSRSVLGSMNDMVNCSKVLLDRFDYAACDLAGQLNSIPYSAVKYESPKRVMMALPLEE